MTSIRSLGHRWVLTTTLSFALIQLSSVEALAKCASPRPTLVPASGKIPVAAKLWLLVPGTARTVGSPVVLAAQGQRRVPVEVRKLSTVSPDVQAFLVEIGTSPPGELVISIDDGSHWALTVDGAWRAPRVRRTAPTIKRVESSWTCSHELAQNLTFPRDAAGYHVIIAKTRQGLDLETHGSIYLPDTNAMFYYEPPKSVSTATLGIGYLNCFGDTFRYPGDGAWVEVYALMPDGSEPIVTTMPLYLPNPFHEPDAMRPVP